jgi:hypothetical protein
LCNNFCHAKVLSGTYSERVFVALGSQLAKYMCCTLLSVVDFRLRRIFPDYLINGTVFEIKELCNITCILILYANFGCDAFLVLKEFNDKL